MLLKGAKVQIDLAAVFYETLKLDPLILNADPLFKESGGSLPQLSGPACAVSD